MKLGTYRHYKGKNYEVIGIARHTETLEELVVYFNPAEALAKGDRALYDDPKFGKNSLWVRPKKMFLEKLEVDGKIIERFKYIGK